MNQIQPFSGQSNYDLTIGIYGSLDNFIPLLSENNIPISSKTTNNPYVFTPTSSNINSNFAGITYATQSIQINNLIPLENNDGNALENNDGTDLFNN